MTFDSVLEAADADEVAERLFELANATHVIYSVCGSEITIGQDPAVVGTGGCVWDTAYVLSRWAESRVAAWRARLTPPRRLRVLEVGAGCGLLGIALAHMGCDVIVSEQPSAMANLAANASANAPTRDGGSVCALQLDWSHAVDVATAAASGPYDLIVGTDVVYALEAVEPLLGTLHECAHDQTLVWLCLQQREPVATAALRELVPAYFGAVDELPLGEEHDLPHSAGVECFLLQLGARRRRARAGAA